MLKKPLPTTFYPLKASDMGVQITVRDVSVEYQAPDGDNLPALGPVTFDITAGTFVCLLGPSGCGKSTLLNILGTLDTPDRGSIELFGRDPQKLDDTALSVLRASQIGFIFQLHHLLPHLTAFENILVPTLADPRSEDRKIVADRARHLLDRVGLSSDGDKKPAQLSGGERQRVAVVRALIRQPNMILADEPTGALDATNAASLADLLLELHSGTPTALVVVTHDLNLASRMSRRLTLEHGHLV